MEFSPQQAVALEKGRDWLRAWAEKPSRDRQIFRVFGYAGTGKTTIARHLVKDTGLEAAYGAYTGKAAMVMRSAGCTDARTIHSLVYTPEIDERTGKITFSRNDVGPISDAQVVVIDECSMVDQEIGRDLMSFNKPILVLGDPEQLPPVKETAGFFTNCDPDVMLTEIHRQAADNPIIDIATRVRLGDRMPDGDYGESRIVARRDLDSTTYRELIDRCDQVLCGRTVTRNAINIWMRKNGGLKVGLLPVSGSNTLPHFPLRGDKLVCRKNDKKLGIFNGQMFTAVSDHELDGSYVEFEATPDDDEEADPIKVRCHIRSFNGEPLDQVPWELRRKTQHFEFGYALTVHLAQGSQWPNVMVRDESRIWKEDARRWLYTAVTRAADRIFVVR